MVDHPAWQDALEHATRNCPKCLEPMDARIGAWWCENCGIAIQLGVNEVQGS